MGQLKNRRGQQAVRKNERKTGMRNNYDRVKKKIVAKAVNHARRNNGLRTIVRNRLETRERRREVVGQELKTVRERRPAPVSNPKRRYSPRQNLEMKLRHSPRPVPKVQESRREIRETRVVKGRVPRKPRVAENPPRVLRRSPPDERRIVSHRSMAPGMHSFPAREEPSRVRLANHDAPPMREMERLPPRPTFPPRVREGPRGYRESPPPEKAVFLRKMHNEPPRRRMDFPEHDRSLGSPPERGSIMRRNRSLGRNKRMLKSEREGDLPKRSRDAPSRKPEKYYGHLEDNPPRMLPRGYEELHRRPAPDRGPPYRGTERPPPGYDFARTRSITPPLRFLKSYSPRRHIQDLEMNHRFIRSGRREDFPPAREPISIPYDLERERVRMDPYPMGPDFRHRMIHSRRSMEREMQRERDWRPPPMPRHAGPLPRPRGRSAERNVRYNIPPPNFHYDSISRR